MFKKLSLLLLLMCVALTEVCAAQINKFVVFGDSLSDNGNIYEYLNKQLPPSPPYFKGRFSNGYIWVERLAQKYYPQSWREHILDYAFGGAGVDFSTDDGQDDQVLFSLGREIDSYLLVHHDKADAESLYSVWMGSNNYMASHNNPAKTAEVVNAGIKQKLEKLAIKGAKHVLVINLPDMGQSPVARMIYSEKALSLCSKLHNEGLNAVVSELHQKYPDVHWMLYDAAETFADAMRNPDKYGFTNTTDTCYQALANSNEPDTEDTKFVLKMSTNLQNKKDACEGFFFFDPVHPTALTHQVMADMIAEYLQAQDIEII